MPSPLVSVIICTYNQQEFIRDTVQSVITQTYPRVEIIISDDGSTDATPDILRDTAQRYPGRTKIVLSEINTGIPANINRGLAVRTGELVAWLDGDDLMLPRKI
jgi:glycosyltransferase involved in cell wall biosynthesis